MKWRFVREVLEAAARNFLVRVVVGLLAVLGGVEAATPDAVIDPVVHPQSASK